MRKTGALLVAVVILAVAGGATAADRYLITNIHQIKPSVVKHLRGQRGRRGRRGQRGQRGLQGPVGRLGATGATGAQGASGLASVGLEEGSVVDAPPASGSEEFSAATASCPAGTTPVSGGWVGDPNNPPLLMSIIANTPDSQVNGWEIVFFNDDTSDAAGLTAIVNCAVPPSSGGAATDLRRMAFKPTAASLAAARRALARLEPKR